MTRETKAALDAACPKTAMSETMTTLVSMIIQGKTGEEYKKLLASLNKEERSKIENYRKKFKETKLAQKAAENFFESMFHKTRIKTR